MNLKKITVPLVLLILSLGVSAQQQETFNNPVINADVPDPSMIRVGDFSGPGRYRTCADFDALPLGRWLACVR